MRKFLKSLHDAKNGLHAAWSEERNFRIELMIGLVVLIVMIIFDFSAMEFIPVIIMITLVVMSEIMNTALEDLGDIVQPDYDPMIGKIKDLASAFVLVASIGALVVGAVIFVSHFTSLL